MGRPVLLDDERQLATLAPSDAPGGLRRRLEITLLSVEF
jgi:hypothetical protein